MGDSSNRDKTATDRAKKALAALELRLAGHTYAYVADAVGLPHASNARKLILWAIKQIPAEKAAEVRQLELERLDAMMRGIWERATNGNGRAIDRVLRLMTRRAALLGLDAPKQSTVDIQGGLAEFLATAFGGKPAAAEQSDAQYPEDTSAADDDDES